MNKTYLFYDIETTGLNPCFDQVLQFAAIRTDLKLRELERYELRVKLNCDVTPSPAAIITHRIGMSELQTGIDEYAALLQIHHWFNTPGTISLGYNTLGFDDEFLRFSFYRHLLPPYTHQFANECSRMDLYPLTVMYYLFKPSVLRQWPQVNQQPSLKLERLNEVNQLVVGQAHNAMVDVEATLALARNYSQEREMWDFLLGYFSKETDLNRMNQLDSEALLVDGKLGSQQNYLAPVLKLGQHCQYKNQTLWLRLDLENLIETTVDNIPKTTYVIRKKFGESELLLPVKPRYLEKVSLDRQQLAKKNKTRLQENPELLTAICNYHRQYIYPKIPGIDPNAALYDLGFPTPHEENLFRQFHQAPASQKMTIAQQFSHPVHQQLALRIMGRHFPNELTAEQLNLFNQYLQKSLYGCEDGAGIDYRGQYKLTVPVALTDLNTLKNSALSAEQLALLDEFNNYYRQTPRYG